MAAEAMIRLLLVDDHPVVLGGLRAALEDQEGFEVATAGTVGGAREFLSRHEVDVGLIDIRLPDGSGLELLSLPSSRHPTLAWIVLSTFDAPQYVAAAFELGAAGYLLKTTPLIEVADAIRRVAAGGTAFDARQLGTARAVEAVRLTRTEQAIVRAVLAGRSNDEIAGNLNLARKTVEAYLTRLFARFGVATRTELALRAEREDWFEGRRDRGVPGA
jgi:DNA-binding NarL/FixJ family response regulator